MMRLLVSACLLGLPCRYDGASKGHPLLPALLEQYTVVPVCPEQLGGLPTPRPPAERRGERVVTQCGKDVTEQYRRGAQAALTLCRMFHCEAAVLKERSPSCGYGEIYDGSFSRHLIPDDGVTAALLREAGIPVFGESQMEELLK